MRSLSVVRLRLTPPCLGLLVLGGALFWTGEAGSFRSVSLRTPGRPALAAAPKGEASIDPALKAAFDKARLGIMNDFCKDLEKEVQWAIKRKLRSEAREVVKRIIRVHPEYGSIDKLKKDVTSAPKPTADDDLSKDQQSTDWGAASLSEEQVKYAASDVLHQSLLQLSVPNQQRGRAMGSWIVVIGSAPLGQLQMGKMSDITGSRVALLINGSALIAVAMVMGLVLPRLRRL